MIGFKSNFLTLIFLLACAVAFGQRGRIIRASTLGASNPMDIGNDRWITASQTGFSATGLYWVDEFEIPMFGIPKLGGDVTNDNIGRSCGITDLIPDSLAYSVYAVKKANNLIFRFRVGDDNPSVESWTILLDTDGKMGNTGPDADPNYTADNPGFEIDITLIKRNNAGVFVYNIDGISNCPNELLFYGIATNFQISIADEVTCGDPDYFYDYFIPFDELTAAYFTATGVTIDENSGLRFAAATNVSATCAMDGKIADVSGVDNNDLEYSGCVSCAFIDLIENQCPTPIVDLAPNGPGFEKEKVTKPTITLPIEAGQTYIAGTTVESNIYIKLFIYENIGTESSPSWGPTPRETQQGYTSGTTWIFNLSSPLIGYDSIVARTQLTATSVPCGSGGNNTSSTSITIVEPNKKPIANVQNLVTPEDTPLTPITLTGSDPDGDPITFSIVPGSGPTNGNISGSGVNWTYTPFSNYVGSDSFSFKVADRVYDSINVINITVTPVNDPPVVNGNTSSIAYTSVQSSIAIDNSLIVTDVDDVNIETATVTITTNFVLTEDVLLFTNTVKISGVYSNGVLTLTGTATKAEYTAALASVMYSNTNNRPSILTRSIRFLANDGDLNSAPFNRNIIFSITNYPPIASDDAFSTNEDTPLTTNVTSNDSDVDGPGATYLLVSGVSDGTLSFNADGSFTYTPNTNYFGSDQFTYNRCDGATPNLCDQGIVAITINAINDAPVTVNDAVSTNEDTPVTFNILSNDTDIDNSIDPTTVILTPTSVAGKGTFTYNGGGSVTLTPTSNFSGTVLINYTVKDASGATSNSATITVTVLPFNDNPVAVDDPYTTPEDVALTGNVLTNDSDVDFGNTVSVQQYVVAGDITVYPAGNPAAIAGKGTLVILANGNLTFTPVLNFVGPLPDVTYTIIDGNGGTASAIVRITVTNTNDLPIPGNDSGVTFTTPEEVTLNANVLTNDTDPDGDILSVTQFIVSGTTYSAGATATIANVGSLQINNNGSLIFIPVLNYNGTVPTATYTVSDGTGTANATAVIIVTPVNDNPVAVDDARTVLENNTLTSNVLTNDSDVDVITNGDVLVVTQFVVAGDPTTYSAGNLATITGIGTLVINANGNFTFIPVTNYNGSVPNVSYTISDGNSGSDIALLTITVVNVIDYPIAADDVFSKAEDLILNGVNVLDNDETEIGNTKTVTQFVIAGDAATYSAGNTANIANVGSVQINSNGNLTFTPFSNFNGTVTTVTYTMSDGTGTASASVFITITPVNDNPVAVDNTYTTPEDVVLTANVLGNDSDVDAGNILAVQQYIVAGDVTVYPPGSTTTMTGKGTLVILTNGTLTFTPVLNYAGTIPDISYTISDGIGGTASATVRITVTPQNDLPLPGNDSGVSFTTPEDISFTSNVLTNDIDLDGDALLVTNFIVNGITYPAGTTATIANVGSLQINSNGTLTFVPLLNYTGTVPTITYTVSDGTGTANATIIITVTPVNDAPFAANDVSFTTAEDVILNTENVLANDVDVDLDPLVVTQFVIPGDVTLYPAGNLATIAGIGTLRINTNGSFTFTPALNYNNSSPVLVATYTISDGALTDDAALSIRVTPVNDDPIGGDDNGTGVDNDAFTTPEDTPITLADGANILANDTDPDGDNLTVTQFVIGLDTYLVSPGSSTSAALPGVGTVRIYSDGRLEFSPVLNYNGTVPGITYTNSDGNGGTATAIVNIIVRPVNDPPTVDLNGTTLNLATPEDTPLAFCVDVLETEGEVIVVNGIVQSSANGNTLIVMSQTATQICFLFTPEQNFNGESQWEVNVCDNAIPSACTTVTFIIDVTPTNDSPTAVDDAITSNEDVPVILAILQNDSDVDTSTDPNNRINPSTVDLYPFTPAEEKTFTVANKGTFTVDALGNVTCTPYLNFFGSSITISYSVKDFGGLASNSAVIQVTVLPTNDPPIFVSIIPAILDTIFEDSTLRVSRLAFDAEGDPIVYEITNTHGGGTMPNDPDPDFADFSYRFTPEPNYNGESKWELKACDNFGACTTVQFKIPITPVNDTPSVIDDYRGAQSGIVTTYNDVLDNDLFIEAPYKEFYDIFEADSTDTLVIDRLETFNGTAIINTDGEIQYAPSFEFMGTDSIRYWIRDSGNLYDSGLVIINVGPPPFRIYHGVSPNNDGQNDYWRIDGIEEFSNNLVRLYDRFNNLVFETTGYNNESNHWKGQANHGLAKSALPEGTYFYSILLGDGSGPIGGYVVLKRK